MNIDLSHIKALAKAATPGPWHCDQCSLFIFGPDGGDMIASTDDGDDGPVLLIRGAGARLPMDENAAFIAACDPTTVLALIAEVERLENLAYPMLTLDDLRAARRVVP